MNYKIKEPKEGEPLVYLGVYITKWRPEWGEPSVGFVNADYTLADAYADLDKIFDLFNPEHRTLRLQVKTILEKMWQ